MFTGILFLSSQSLSLAAEEIRATGDVGEEVDLGAKQYSWWVAPSWWSCWRKS